jgi:hypothetical protein
MTQIFLERRFQPAITPADVTAMATSGGDCFEIHRVRWLGSLLSRDGGRMLCWFAAPDAESARTALRQAGADTSVLWPGTVHPGPDPNSPQVVVERRFDEPVELDTVSALEASGAWCLETHRITFVRTFHSLDRRRMICLYRAPDAESVRLAQRQIGMPVERVWGCTAIGPAA